MATRARERARALLQSHRPAPLDDELADTLDQILAQAERELGQD
jgi:hypothetical protein